MQITRRLSYWFIPFAAVLIFGTWLWVTPPGLFGKVNALGYAVCHRISERSFHYDNGEALPLCARCSGMYLGAVLGIIFQLVVAGRLGGMPRWQVWVPLGLWGLSFAFDGGNSYLYLMKSLSPEKLAWIPTLYTPNNILRLFTGFGAGLAIAAAVYPSFTQTMWRTWQGLPALTPRRLLVLTGLSVVVMLLVLIDSDIVLYPAAIISAGGILLVLTMVYSMVWVMVMRQENSYNSWRELWLPLLAGLTVAMLQIVLIDLFRLWLTGTWGEFPLK